jgi:predicted nucleotidyltransferase
MSPQINDIIKAFVSDTKKILQDNLVNEYLFGSYAKNMQNDLSDIDILIIVKQLNSQIRKEISSLSSSYSLDENVIISPILKDENIWKKNEKYNTLFYREIIKYGILI